MEHWQFIACDYIMIIQVTTSVGIRQSAGGMLVGDQVAMEI